MGAARAPYRRSRRALLADARPLGWLAADIAGLRARHRPARTRAESALRLWPRAPGIDHERGDVGAGDGAGDGNAAVGRHAAIPDRTLRLVRLRGECAATMCSS